MIDSVKCSRKIQQNEDWTYIMYNIMYIYCIFTEMNTVHNFISLLIHTSVSCVMAFKQS